MKNELFHYGVKGQKWGIRRYQNEDGTLTPEGLRRYGIVGEDGKLRPSYSAKSSYSNWKRQNRDWTQSFEKEKKTKTPISKRRSELIESYRKSGLTQSQAEIAAFRRERTEKALKVVGGIALTAALAYGTYKGVKLIQNNKDLVLKKGTTLFRTTGDSSINADHSGFVATNPKDAIKYKGLYGQQLRRNGTGRINQFTAQTNDDIRIAGDKEGRKTMKYLLKNDPDFAAANDRGRTKWRLLMRGSNGYKDFNARLVDHTDADAITVQKKFYDALKKKGYSGIVDVNDRDRSGYNSKNPVILFNLKDSITNEKVSVLGNKDIDSAAKSAKRLIARQTIPKEALKGATLFGGLGALSIGKDLKEGESANRKMGTVGKNVINQYKKEHPNTKLTDDEILKNELGYGR